MPEPFTNPPNAPVPDTCPVASEVAVRPAVLGDTAQDKMLPVSDTPSPPPADPLLLLAHEINASHLLCLGSAQSTLAYGIATGKKLLEAKGLVRSRKEPWEPWVSANCTFDIRQAQKYMRLAKNENRYRENLPSEAISSINAALDLIATPKSGNKNVEGSGGDFHREPANPVGNSDGDSRDQGPSQGARASDNGDGGGNITFDSKIALPTPEDSVVSPATDGHDEQIVPDLAEPANLLDELQQEKSETLLALHRNTVAVMSQFAVQIASADWRQIPPEMRHSLNDALDQLIAVAHQASDSLEMDE